MNARVVVALVLLGAGCDGGRAAPDASQPPVDVATPPDAPPEAPDASSCLSPDECDLEAFQREIVAKLSGAMDIAPGVRLLHRASAVERMTTRAFLLDELTALGFAPELQTYATGANVVARLDATTGGGDLIVVGAHFDSVSAGPGAADNATGVAIVLAVARRVRDLPVREHPIAFALFDEEESGLIGSRAYAAALAGDGTTVAAAHVFDMLSFDGDGDRAIELWSPTPALATLYQQRGAAAGVPVASYTFTRSDHQAFLDRGMPAVGIGEEFNSGDHTPHYHKATDTFDKISFAYLGSVTRLAIDVIETSL